MQILGQCAGHIGQPAGLGKRRDLRRDEADLAGRGVAIAGSLAGTSAVSCAHAADAGHRGRHRSGDGLTRGGVAGCALAVLATRLAVACLAHRVARCHRRRHAGPARWQSCGPGAADAGRCGSCGACRQAAARRRCCAPAATVASRPGSRPASTLQSHGGLARPDRRWCWRRCMRSWLASIRICSIRRSGQCCPHGAKIAAVRSRRASSSGSSPACRRANSSPLNPFSSRAQLAAGPDFSRAAMRWQPVWPPGSHFEESPVNAQLLALVAARLEGVTFASRVAEAPVVARRGRRRLGDAGSSRAGDMAAHCCLRASIGDWLRLALVLAADGRSRRRRSCGRPGTGRAANGASPGPRGIWSGFPAAGAAAGPAIAGGHEPRAAADDRARRPPRCCCGWARARRRPGWHGCCHNAPLAGGNSAGHGRNPFRRHCGQHCIRLDRDRLGGLRSQA